VAVFLRTKAFYGLTYLLGILGDVFGFFKTVAMFIRDRFFGWLPREAIFQAIRDLRDGVVGILLSPLGLVEGWWAAVSKSTLPILTSVVFLVSSGVFVLSLEVVLLVWGIQRGRPSNVLLSVAWWLWSVFFTLMSSFYHLTHLKELVMSIVRALFGWIDPDLVKQGTHAIYNATAVLFSAPGRGIQDGYALLNEQYNGLGVFVGILLAVPLAYALYRQGAYWINRYRNPLPMPGASHDEDSDDDGDAPGPGSYAAVEPTTPRNGRGRGRRTD